MSPGRRRRLATTAAVVGALVGVTSLVTGDLAATAVTAALLCAAAVYALPAALTMRRRRR